MERTKEYIFMELDLKTSRLKEVKKELLNALLGLENSAKRIQTQLEQENNYRQIKTFGMIYSCMSGATSYAIKLEQEYNSLIDEIVFLKQIISEYEKEKGNIRRIVNLAKKKSPSTDSEMNC